jgi:hypothetical protein
VVRPKPGTPRRQTTPIPGDPDIRFLTAEELDSLLAATPDDGLGRMERVLYLAAAMTGDAAGLITPSASAASPTRPRTR